MVTSLAVLASCDSHEKVLPSRKHPSHYLRLPSLALPLTWDYMQRSGQLALSQRSLLPFGGFAGNIHLSAQNLGNSFLLKICATQVFLPPTLYMGFTVPSGFGQHPL